MADDTSGLPKLHPDDRRELFDEIKDELRAILEASARAPALPPPGRPPADLDGLDARHFESFRADLLREVAAAVRRETSEFLPEDDIERRIEAVTSGVSTTIDRRFDAFKVSFLDEVKKAIADEVSRRWQELFEILDDIGLPVEKGEKRKKTRERIEGLIAIHDGSKEFRSEMWRQFRTSIIGWLFGLGSAALVYLGFRGGPSH